MTSMICSIADRKSGLPSPTFASRPNAGPYSPALENTGQPDSRLIGTRRIGPCLDIVFQHLLILFEKRLIAANGSRKVPAGHQVRRMSIRISENTVANRSKRSAANGNCF